ncbi:flagellar brake protein [Arhodomonas sp. AD133]|uniref:flagellar brake protein n=1 Tax=Arhodomonas sp. AD133 TaxID=3415009 RepID=UPI003EBACAFB
MDYENEPDCIRNPGQLVSILRRLHESRTLLDVHLPGRGVPYRSAMLYVDADRRLITLDELRPERGHWRVEQGTELRIVSRTFGVDTRFTVTVEEIGLQGGIYYYVAPFPEEIIYHQRRRFVRVPVPAMRQSESWLEAGERRTQFELYDISAGGIGAYVLHGTEPETGKVYTCHVGLKDSEALEAEVEVRHCSYDRTRRRTRFGARFINFSDADRSGLQRLVLSLQRELLRKT